MYKQQVVASCAAFLIVVSLQAGMAVPQAEGKLFSENRPMDLKYLGSMEGKQFFYDNSTQRDWATAQAYCAAANMELASIELLAESELIISAIKRLGVPTPYVNVWTSGRVATVPDAFQWTNSGNRLSQSAITRWYTSSYKEFCVFLQVDPGDYFIYGGYPCNMPQYGVLCQLQA